MAGHLKTEKEKKRRMGKVRFNKGKAGGAKVRSTVVAARAPSCRETTGDELVKTNSSRRGEGVGISAQCGSVRRAQVACRNSERLPGRNTLPSGQSENLI